MPCIKENLLDVSTIFGSVYRAAENFAESMLCVELRKKNGADSFAIQELQLLLKSDCHRLRHACKILPFRIEVESVLGTKTTNLPWVLLIHYWLVPSGSKTAKHGFAESKQKGKFLWQAKNPHNHARTMPCGQNHSVKQRGRELKMDWHQIQLSSSKILMLSLRGADRRTSRPQNPKLSDDIICKLRHWWPALNFSRTMRNRILEGRQKSVKICQETYRVSKNHQICKSLRTSSYVGAMRKKRGGNT